ncbi:MAG: tripartite tricarboxylate transporter TctB family protein [Deltaproteobacteria bacterium]|nr:tripartite tricarboxylate transporter TctB family protein [Deltaproteobacteria bacterium]
MKLGPYRIRIKLRALVIPFLCMGYGLYQYLNVRQLPDSEINLVLVEPVFVLMVIFTFWILVKDMEIRRENGEKKGRADGSFLGSTNRLLPRSPAARKSWAFIGLSILYLGLIQPVGFIVCNPAFLVAGMLLLGVRKWPVLTILPAAATAAIYLLFRMWMQVPIPAGFLDFPQ